MRNDLSKIDNAMLFYLEEMVHYYELAIKKDIQKEYMMEELLKARIELLKFLLQ